MKSAIVQLSAKLTSVSFYSFHSSVAHFHLRYISHLDHFLVYFSIHFFFTHFHQTATSLMFPSSMLLQVNICTRTINLVIISLLVMQPSVSFYCRFISFGYRRFYEHLIYSHIYFFLKLPLISRIEDVKRHLDSFLVYFRSNFFVAHFHQTTTT